MRRLFFVGISVCCAVPALGCNQDPKHLFADFQWVLQCSASSSASCTMDSPPREVLGFDGYPNEADTSADVNATCSFNRANTQAIVGLSVSEPGYSIAVDGIVIDDSGTGNFVPNVGSNCQVTVTETEPFALNMVGSCSPDPADAAPCDVQVQVTRVDGDAALNVKVSCVEITSPSDPVNIVRDLYLGSATAAPTDPAYLQIRSCPGQ